MALERLDKFISDTMGITRKEAKEALSKGRVTVNGIICKKGDIKVSAEDEVCFDGIAKKKAGLVYILLNKPAGYLSATEDKKDKTVLDLLAEKEEFSELAKRAELFPVGRLDKDTEGLLILTNDGKLAHFLLSPKRHVDKTYYAIVDKVPVKGAEKAFEEGIQVGEEYRALPAKLERLSDTAPYEILVTLHEGKFHQVKRMCHEVGSEVVYLKRIKFGNIELDKDMQPGYARFLKEEEIEGLFSEVGANSSE
ncbi:MAG: rRNA pseudouridine synthase [Lachnospiraceae bacterium]|nr:rRNA pseudouridine synthase [Lachnospiraceae bacterium]